MFLIFSIALVHPLIVHKLIITQTTRDKHVILDICDSAAGLDQLGSGFSLRLEQWPPICQNVWGSDKMFKIYSSVLFEAVCINLTRLLFLLWCFYSVYNYSCAIIWKSVVVRAARFWDVVFFGFYLSIYCDMKNK